MRQLLVFVFLLITLLAQRITVQAQPKAHSIDSLKVLLKQSRADTNRANLLLELARSYVMKPGELASDLDTALVLIRQAHGLSRFLRYEKGQGKAYLIGAKAYREKGETQQARKFGQTAINRFAKNGNTAELAAAHMELGNTYDNSYEGLARKIYHYEKALPLFRTTINREREATTLKELGDFYQIIDKNQQSLILLKRALVIYQEIGFKELQGLYDLLGLVSVKLTDYKNGINYGLLALKTAELRQDTSLQLCTIYFRLGNTYTHLEQYTDALGNFQKALAIAEKHKNESYARTVVLGMVIVYADHLQQAEPALALLQRLTRMYPPKDIAAQIRTLDYQLYISSITKQFEKAESFCRKLLALSANLPKYTVVRAGVNLNVGSYYLNRRRYSDARRLFNENKEIGIFLKDTFMLSSYYRNVYKLDSAESNYAAALEDYKQFKYFQEARFKKKQLEDIAKLQIEYQTEKKEQQLQLKEKDIQVLTNRNSAQQANLRQKEMLQNSTIGGAVLLMLLLGLTYNRYRLKQRSNQQLEAKQRLIDQKNQSLQQVLGEKDQLLGEREWMLREIHHRVKNNLQVISSMLNSQFDFLKDPTALAAIRESQNRVQAMALIHQKLYISDNLGQINMREYIHEIVDYLIESFDQHYTVSTRLDVAAVHLDVALATPLGLIINEAVTNSLKYAFPKNRSGTVAIRLVSVDRQTYRLTMSDDGIGLPTDFDFTNSHTLGLTMIRGLSKQIKGKLEITQDQGVEISLQFSIAKKPVKTALQLS